MMVITSRLFAEVVKSFSHAPFAGAFQKLIQLLFGGNRTTKYPQAKSSSWLARRLKNHLQAFGLIGAPAPAPMVSQEPDPAVVQKPSEVTVQESATEQEESVVETKAKAAKKGAKKT